MKKFAFKLAPLLKMRESQRDRCRQALAEALGAEALLVARMRSVEADRARQAVERKRLAGEGPVDVDGSAARQYYSVHLLRDLEAIERERALAAQRIEQCRQFLVRADQAVRSLEKLADRQLAAFQYESERHELHELEEAWRAARAGVPEPC